MKQTLSHIFLKYSYSKTTSPTNLREHLSHKHEIELASTKTIDKHQRTLTDVFCNVVKKKIEPKDEKRVFSRRMALWFSRDLIPFSAVTGIGFQDFWRSLNIKYELPDETTLRRAALDDIYACLKKQVIEKLEDISTYVTIGIDSWTDGFRRITYNTASLHYIENHKMLSIVLKTGPFPPPHNAITYKVYFEKLVDEYKLRNKTIKLITDGASTMKAFAKSTNLKRYGCLAHSVNRLIQHDLMASKDPAVKPLKDLIVKLRNIQKKLVFKGEELRKIYREDKQKQLQLSIDFEELQAAVTADGQIQPVDFDESDSRTDPVSTFGDLRAASIVRWCCTYKLAKFCMDHLGTIKKYFQEKEEFDYVLKADEVEILSGLIELLEIFTTFTRIIQGDKYPTINFHVLFYTTIEDKLLTMLSLNENEVVLGAAEILYEHLEKRMGLFTESVAAAILDPMFQNLPMIDEWIDKHDTFETRLDLIEAVCKEMNIQFNEEPVNECQSSRNNIPNKSDQTTDENSNLIRSLVQKYTQDSRNVRATSLNSDLKSELQRFRAINDHPNDLEKFWADNKICFPKLNVISEAIHGIPLTTAKEESSFSISGCLIRSRRASLAPERAERILFIHDNYNLFNV